MSAARAFLAQHNAARAARLGELLDPLDHPAFLAEAGSGRLVGMLTYVPDPDWQRCEILAIHATEQWHGAGTALIAAIEQLAAHHGCIRLWLITTNDNVDALRFYQRRGFRLAALHRGAVDYSRTHLKPEIPVVGDYGIPLRDEIELENGPEPRRLQWPGRRRLSGLRAGDSPRPAYPRRAWAGALRKAPRLSPARRSTGPRTPVHRRVLLPVRSARGQCQAGRRLPGVCHESAPGQPRLAAWGFRTHLLPLTRSPSCVMTPGPAARTSRQKAASQSHRDQRCPRER